MRAWVTFPFRGTSLSWALAIALPCLPAAAKESSKPGEKPVPLGPRSYLLKLDANKNGRIDGPEVDKLREAFAGAMHEELARFDLNKDGRLDAIEVAGIRLRGGAKTPARSSEANPAQAPVK